MFFVNYTNHRAALWSDAQKRAAEIYGDIVDIPFREVPPNADEAEVARIADEELKKILAYRPAAVLCQGEMTLMYALVKRLTCLNIPVLAACSRRESIERLCGDGATVRESVFRFVRFRQFEGEPLQENAQ